MGRFFLSGEQIYKERDFHAENHLLMSVPGVSLTIIIFLRDAQCVLPYAKYLSSNPLIRPKAFVHYSKYLFNSPSRCPVRSVLRKVSIKQTLERTSVSGLILSHLMNSVMNCIQVCCLRTGSKILLAHAGAVLCIHS